MQVSVRKPCRAHLNECGEGDVTWDRATFLEQEV
jgi:hypothetical protein